MTSKERVLSSVSHKQPDRVPIDLGSMASTSISAVAYSNLLKYLNMDSGHTRIYDINQQLAIPADEILARFRVDSLDLTRIFNQSNDEWYDFKLFNGNTAQYPHWFKPSATCDGSFVYFNRDNEEVARQVSGANFFNQSLYPWQDDYPLNLNLDSLEAAFRRLRSSASAPLWVDSAKDNFWQNARHAALEFRAKTDKAIMITAGCNLFESGTTLRRIDNFLADLICEQANVEKFLDLLLQLHLRKLENICKYFGDIADICCFGDDLGMDTNAFMSADTYRKFFKPRHKYLCDYVKKHTSMKTFLHSCGSISSLLPDLIEAGFDIVNPVQTSAYNMSAEMLKREFGKDISFWGGGVCTRAVLNRKGPKEVREDVLRRLECFSKGGGYVFCAIHNILPEVRAENIVAMYDAVDEFNRAGI